MKKKGSISIVLCLICYLAFVSCEKDILDGISKEAVADLESYKADPIVHDFVYKTTGVMRSLVSTDNIKNKYYWDSLVDLYEKQMQPHLLILKEKMSAYCRLHGDEVLSDDGMISKDKYPVYLRGENVTLEDKYLSVVVKDYFVARLSFFGIIDREPDYIVDSMYLSYESYYRWSLFLQVGGKTIRDTFFDGFHAYGLSSYGGMHYEHSIMINADYYNGSNNCSNDYETYPYFGSGADAPEKWYPFLDFMEESRRNYLAMILIITDKLS